MREAVQLGAAAAEVAAAEVVDVAGVAADSSRTARACGTNMAMDTKKGAIFMVASVGEGVQNSGKY